MCFSDQYLNISVSLLLVSVLVCVCAYRLGAGESHAQVCPEASEEHDRGGFT